MDWDGERRIAVTTEVRRRRIVVTVRDSGPGIAAAEIDHVFNPFYTTKVVGKGTGLGLSVSDGIVREHGGSHPRRVVWQWRRVRRGAADRSRPRCRRTRRHMPTESSTGRSISMLVVDDEPAIRSAIVRYFAGLGHTVDAAGTGAEAHALLESRRYDALLLDLRMPDTSGDAIYRELLERDPAHAARVIFLTGDVQSDVDAAHSSKQSGRASVDEAVLVRRAHARRARSGGSLMSSVLIVDDERPVTDAFAAFFERHGNHAVSCAYTGAEAIAAYEASRPDLVLLDLRCRT